MIRNEIYVGTDVDDVHYHGSALDRTTGEALEFQCRPTLKGLVDQLKSECDAIRTDWTLREVQALFAKPFSDLSMETCAGLGMRPDAVDTAAEGESQRYGPPNRLPTREHSAVTSRSKFRSGSEV